MDSKRLSQVLGWGSVGCGLGLLTFADGIGRLFGARRRSGLVRALGVRDVLIGMGLLTQRDPRPWLWARVAGEVMDLSLMGTTLEKRAGSSAWRLASIAGGLGLALLDVYAATTASTGPSAGRVTLPEASFDPRVPTESWRGSGLAEDVGVRQSDAEADDA